MQVKSILRRKAVDQEPMHCHLAVVAFAVVSDRHMKSSQKIKNTTTDTLFLTPFDSMSEYRFDGIEIIY